MKRIGALLALVLIGLPCLSAAGTGDFVLSPRIGFNLATFIGEDVTPDVNYREGMCFGWCLEYPFNPRMVARAELLYTQKGSEVDFAEGFVVDQMVFRVDYLELPVLLRLNLTTGKPTTPFILLGPAFAVPVALGLLFVPLVLFLVSNFWASRGLPALLLLLLSFLFITSYPHVVISVQSCPGRYEVTDDNILLKPK